MALSFTSLSALCDRLYEDFHRQKSIKDMRGEYHSFYNHYSRDDFNIKNSNGNIMEQNGKTKIDVAKLQVQVGNLTDDVKSIKDNHLPHIYERLGGIEKKIAYYSGGFAIIIIIAEAIINKIQR